MDITILNPLQNDIVGYIHVNDKGQGCTTITDREPSLIQKEKELKI